MHLPWIVTPERPNDSDFAPVSLPGGSEATGSHGLFPGGSVFLPSRTVGGESRAANSTRYRFGTPVTAGRIATRLIVISHLLC